MIPALAQICSLNSPFDEDIREYAAGACHAIECWIGKLDAYLEQHTAPDVRALLEKHDVVMPVASFQGGLLASQGEARREHWSGFERRLKRCRELAIGTLVVTGDVAPPIGQQDLARVRFSLKEAAQRAADHDVRLALEFQGRAAAPNNLQTAAALIAEVAEPNLGLCFDVFHYYIGPSKQEDLAYLTAENLFHVQLSDLAGQAREFAVDADRVLPGDGDFLLGPLVSHLTAISYQGLVSVELMNPQIWQIPPRQFGEIAMTALRKVLGQASME